MLSEKAESVAVNVPLLYTAPPKLQHKLSGLPEYAVFPVKVDSVAVNVLSPATYTAPPFPAFGHSLSVKAQFVAVNSPNTYTAPPLAQAP